jgi:hypothetical protein
MSAGFLLGDGFGNPRTPDGVDWEWNRGVKIFEGSNMVTLEAAINTWIVAFRNATDFPAIIDTIYIGVQGNNSRVLVSYGYFSPP